MPKSSVTFDLIEESPGTYDCQFCGHNPATLKCTGAHEGPVASSALSACWRTWPSGR